MSVAAVFWVIAGFAAGVAACFVLIPVLRRVSDDSPGNGKRLWIGAAAAIGLFSLALVMYLQLGRPDVLEAGVAGDVGRLHAGLTTSESGKVASMEVSVQRLADKLASGGGSDAEWDLLAQSYEFLSNAPAASEARQHRSTGASAPSTAAPSDLATYEQKVDATPDDVQAWRGLAALKRNQRDFTGAIAAYGRLRSLKGMTADAWADYADALASQPGGTLAGPAADAIEQALKLDKNHAKALWLKATLAIQQQRYADAVKLWQRLRGVLPAESPDIRIIDANIEEAQTLARVEAPVAGSVSIAATAAGVQISGTVDVDAALRGKLRKGMTLFVYAKAANTPGPPLAVLRQPVGSWPTKFVLDDSLAMMPDRRLSDFRQVIVEARLSATGQAIATAGDLQGNSVEVDTKAAKPVALRIGQVIG